MKKKKAEEEEQGVDSVSKGGSGDVELEGLREESGESTSEEEE